MDSLSGGYLGEAECLPEGKKVNFRKFENAMFQVAKAGSPFLFEGFAGVVYSKHFSLLPRSLQQEWLRTLGLQKIETFKPELIAGNAGILLALLRLKNPDQKLEARVLRAIISKIETSKHGNFWRMPSEDFLKRCDHRALQLKNWDVPLSSINCTVDLGFAHGIAGTLFVLSQYCLHRKRSRKKLQPFIAGLSKYLISMIELSKPSSLASFAFQHSPINFNRKQPTTQAWCYGLPGVSLSLLWAGKALSSEKLVSEALRQFKNWNKSARRRQRYYNSRICHGTAGLAEISRFFSEEIDEKATETAWSYWRSITQKKLKVEKQPPRPGLLEGQPGAWASLNGGSSKLTSENWSGFLGTSHI
jgi:lantibiotic modifying enzyme